ncbi:MAG: hypothetical protein ACHQK8_00120 [Bacteroidia bacterium]
MKKTTTLLSGILLSMLCSAQFGYVKKAELEKVKDSRTVVVLNNDSAYNASIKMAVEKYWSFTGTVFAYDSALKPYNKGDFTFLVFSKGKLAKIRAKVNTSEEDFNGLQLLKKYKRRSPMEDVIARSFCSNHIDTVNWQAELIRAVQLMNNYFNYAVEAKGDLNPYNYPSDKSLMMNKKLLIPLPSAQTAKSKGKPNAKSDHILDVQGKVDANTLLDGEVEEVDRDDIDKAIIAQDQSSMIYFFSVDEKHCSKLVVTADKSELMYFETDSPERCACTVSDLKAMKAAKMKANK